MMFNLTNFEFIKFKTYKFPINDSKVIEKRKLLWQMEQIAHYEQFHFSPQLFQKSSAVEAQEGYILVCGKCLKP